MTLSSTTNTVSYTGDASTTAFPVTYAFFGTGTSAEIEVIEVTIATGAEVTKSNGSDYTVTGGEGTTGTVTAATAPAATVKWVINRTTTQTQETDYVENDPFPAESHEQALDRLTMISQEQERALGRTVQLPDGYTGSFDPTLPSSFTANGSLVINSGGDGLSIGPTTTEISNAQTYATNASASADAAAADAATVAADKATVAADKATVAADKATVAADKATTSGYKDAAATSASNAAASAAAAEVAKIEWQGTYNAGTAYALNDAVVYNGSSFICIQAGTGQTPVVGGTAYWDDLANKGADGAGSGDVNGPASATDSGIALFDGTTGKLLKDSTYTITAAGAALLDDANAAAQRTTLGLVIGTDVQAYDVDTLKADTADVLTAGFAATPVNAGTKSSGTYTPDEATGNFQYAVNGGAHTLAPPTNNGSIVVQYTNNGSAGAITTSGFTAVTGDSFTTTNGHDFFCFITKNNGFSHLHITALQ